MKNSITMAHIHLKNGEVVSGPKYLFFDLMGLNIQIVGFSESEGSGIFLPGTAVDFIDYTENI